MDFVFKAADEINGATINILDSHNQLSQTLFITRS